MMLGFAWGRPLLRPRTARPTAGDAVRTPPADEAPPPTVSGRGVSFDWGAPLPRGAYLLTWWVGYAQSASGWPDSYLETDDGRAQHATHAVEWLYRGLCRLDVAAEHPLRLALDPLHHACTRQQYADYLARNRSSLSIGVTTDGVHHLFAVRCRATALPIFTPNAAAGEHVLVGGAV
ncbi:hypothetical protein [Streptomyces chrestomyceticus]|uniref:hypothetical protein n=1 Tax=Streptomyces chrestomyceticus TaxID=68185 RepID=UPI0033C6F24C